MFTSLLIANRGEIACRVIRTCRRLGIRSVAVYSDADRHARHVQEADEALRIGPAEAAASYLDAAALVAAAQAAGAQAVHPGYGFLSEKTVLAEACIAQGIAWVGPRPEVIRQMGSKIESKRIAQRAGVPTVPGYHGDENETGLLLQRAREIGWPLLIKASAGGGGKGMRRVASEGEFVTLLDEARREALRSFGDDRVLLEKLIARPRHLEVQLMGDRHGHLVHLHERECSVQRHYQKVIEEAPAAFLPDRVRQRLHERALLLGHAIGYDSAGTVEFVLDEGTDEPYFLEMNTRLQVEHPVTEVVTGLDLVELQIRVAAGEVLPLAQADIACRGHAIEARVNSEDAAHGYRPQVGRISAYLEPLLEGVRIDSGVQRGSEVTPHYDSMIAKVIGFGSTRDAAARRLRAGLSALKVEGLGVNLHFLRDILAQPAFHARALTTNFLAEVFPGGWQLPTDWREDALAAALYHRLQPARQEARERGDPWGSGDGFRLLGRQRYAPSAWVVEGWAEEPVEASLGRHGTHWRLQIGDGAPVEVQFDGPAAHEVVVTRAGSSRRFGVAPEGGSWAVGEGGQRLLLELSLRLDAMARVAGGAADAQGTVRATMPGLVTTLSVSPGQRVQAGEVVLVLDSMKLLYSYEAKISGEVVAIGCRVGDTVSGGQVLVEIAATPG